MSLTTIYASKTDQACFQPILAYVFQFADGSHLRVSTHPLNATEGGVQPAITGFPHTAQDFFGRIADQDHDAIQSISEHGIDHVAAVGIHLNDPDKFLYQNYERTKGFKGATITAYFLFHDLETGAFSTDYEVKFVGVCDSPNIDNLKITITAKAKTNLQKVQLPSVRISRMCPWTNPRTVEQRAVSDQADSDFYECGETRDLATAPPCANTPETCTRDLRQRSITFAPPDRWSSRGYLDGKTIEGANSPNDAKYGEATPMIYGTSWIEPPVMNVIGDANSTRMEVMLTIGNLGGAGTTNPGRVQKVIVNDVEVPFVAYSSDKPIFRWQWVSTGARDGARNTDAGYDGKGDPYGSTAVIEVVVYRKLAQSESLPRVKVLTGGPDIRTYTEASTYTLTASSNPVWVLLDLLTWANLKYADIDLATFVSVAAVCATSINYKDFNNTTQSHQRFDSSISLRERKAASELVRGILRSINCNLILYRGKYVLQQRGTLAEQQPAAISGSNFNTAVTSKLFTGTTANGYLAWDFDEASYLVDRDGVADFKITQRPISDSPNRVSCQIQDKHNNYAIDAYQLTDPDDVARSQQEVATGIELLGVNSYDQARRVANTYLAEILRGNNRGDTGGTEVYEFSTSVKCVHLRVGQIIRVSNSHWGISNQLARVLQLAPSKNWETVRIRAAFHNDDWYTDAWGQQRSPAPSGAGADAKNRPPYPWQPYAEQPPVSDAMYVRTEWNFAVQQSYETDGGGNSIARLSVRGKLPVTSLSSLKPPVVSTQLTAGTGGALIGGDWQYWAVICAVDAAGKLSAPSAVSSAVIVPAGSGYTLISDIALWADDTTGYRAFLARDASMRFSWSLTGTGTPSTVTFSDYNSASYGPPDTEARKLIIRAKRIELHGVWTLRVDTVAANALTFTGQGWTTNQWANYTVSLVAKDAAGEQKIFNATVTSNTADTLTTAINPVGIALSGDVFVMRPRASVSGSTLTDANLSMSANALKGQELLVVSGPGRGYRYPVASNTSTSLTIEGGFDQAVTIDSRFIVVSPNWLSEYAEHDLSGNADPAQEIVHALEFPNYNGQSILLLGSVAGDGKESLDNLAPMREIYLTGVTGTAPTSDPPGLIRVFQLQSGETVDTSSEPGYAVVPLQYQQPVDVNGFSLVKLWLTADGIEPINVGEIPHPTGTTGVRNYTVRIALSGTDWDNAILWGTSASASYQNELVLPSGATQTPNFSLGDLPAYLVDAPAAPEPPLGAALAILDKGENFALQVTVTPPSPLGGTAGYEREVRYWNDVGLTTPDSDWIELGFVDTASTVSISGPWPRPGANQWVKCRVRSINWDGVKTAWVESSTAQALTPLALPPAITTNDSTVELIDDGDVSQFLFHLALTPASPIGTTTWYEAYVKYYNNVGLTIEDHPDWIYLGGIDLTGILDTSRFERRNINQWAVIRIYGKNQSNKLGAGVNSATLVIPARPTADNLTSVSASIIDRGESWGVSGAVGVPVARTLLRRIKIYIVGPYSGSVTADTRRQEIGDPIAIPGSGDINYATDGKWQRPLPEYSESTQTYRVDVEAEDVYGDVLAPISSSPFTVSPFSFADYTAISLTPDYASVDGGTVRLTGTATPPTNPLCDGAQVYVSRDGGTVYIDVGHQPKAVGSTATQSLDFTVDLPSASTSIKVKLVPSNSTGKQPGVNTVATVTSVTVDPANQPVLSFDGLVQVTLGASTTISRTPGRIGETLVIVVTQDGTGGRVPTWSADFYGTMPQSGAPDAGEKSAYTFVCVDFGAGAKWLLVSERYNI